VTRKATANIKPARGARTKTHRALLVTTIAIACVSVLLAIQGLRNWADAPPPQGSTLAPGETAGFSITCGGPLTSVTVTSGHPRVDEAWTTVAAYYPQEAARVTAIRVETPAPFGGVAGWVDENAPTVIHVSDLHARYAAMSELEATLAHELMHVTQSFDQQQADQPARQREAETREELFKLKRATDQSRPAGWQ